MLSPHSYLPFRRVWLQVVLLNVAAYSSMAILMRPKFSRSKQCCQVSFATNVQVFFLMFKELPRKLLLQISQQRAQSIANKIPNE